MPKKNDLPDNDGILIDSDLLREAKLALEEDRPPVRSKCEICGGDAAPTSTENLCWVCRRLKISAWRDSDQQMSVQE